MIDLKRIHFIALAVVLLIGGMLAGCEEKPAAMVNGEPITEEAVQKELQKTMREHGAEGARAEIGPMRKAVIDQLISETLLLQGAREAGIKVSDEELQEEIALIKARSGGSFQQQLQDAGLTEDSYSALVRERMLKERFIDNLVEEDPVTEEEMKEHYKGSTTPFIRPAQVKIRFIQVDTREQAEAIMQDIKSGKEGFDKVADRLAKEKSAIVNMKYTWIAPEFFKPIVREALGKIRRGAVDGPFETTGGYYIFSLQDRREEGIKTFEEAKPEIREILMRQKRNNALIHWIAGKRKSSDIVVN